MDGEQCGVQFIKSALIRAKGHRRESPSFSAGLRISADYEKGLPVSDCLLKASSDADESAAPARPKDKGEMALHAFAKFKQRNLLARAQRKKAEGGPQKKHVELDSECVGWLLVLTLLTAVA
jgi:hypothetical protein